MRNTDSKRLIDSRVNNLKSVEAVAIKKKNPKSPSEDLDLISKDVKDRLTDPCRCCRRIITHDLNCQLSDWSKEKLGGTD